MIKKIIVVLMFVLFSSSLYSMDIDLGGKMGIGIGWWRGDTYSKNVDVVGEVNATFGGYTSLNLHKYVAMQFELLFAAVSNADKIEGKDFEFQTTYRAFAFEVPVYIKPKYKVGPGEMFLLFGPRFLLLLTDFKVDTETRIGYNPTIHKPENDFSVRRQFHLGLTFGFGYELELGPGKLQMSLHITPYLTDYGKTCRKAIQNEAYFDAGYAFTFDLK